MRDISLVIIRFFALECFVYAVEVIVVLIPRWLLKAPDYQYLGFSFILYTVGAIGLWVLAPKLASLIARDCDPKPVLAGITFSDLHRLAFVLCGLYFVVLSFGDVFNWLHYALTTPSTPASDDPAAMRNYYQLFRYLSQFVLGLVFVLRSQKISEKVLRIDRITL